MKAYSNDLRSRISAAYETNDYTQEQVATLFGVSESTVRNILRRKRQTGSTNAKPHGGGQRPIVDQAAREFITTTVRQNNDRTLEELCTILAKERTLRVSEATMCRLLKALGLPRKKKR
jgi:transposase